MTEVVRGTILIGMPHSGKTTLGRELAARLDQPFTDTDELIERRTQMTCKQLVDDPTRDFDAEQRHAIYRYHPQSPEVVATGGSVAMDYHLITRLSGFGVRIFLDVDVEALEARLPAERIASLNNLHNLAFADLYAIRRPRYESAAEHVLRIAADEPFDLSLERLTDLRQSVGQ